MSNPYGPNTGSAIYEFLKNMVTGASGGDVPKWNASTEQYEPSAPSTIDAADLGSGSATDGQLLTADGSGGAAWENAASGMTEIASETLAADAASIDFTSIPATYKDLVVVLHGRDAAAGAGPMEVSLRFNGDTGNNYDYVLLRGSGSSTVVSNASSISRTRIGSLPGNGAPADLFGTVVVDIPDYAGGHKKSLVSRVGLSVGTGATDNYVEQYGGNWRSTAAINQVTILDPTNNLKAGTKATLYGRGLA